MSITDYTVVKSSFPLLKDLTLTQFETFMQMNSKLKKMLTIDWSRPDSIGVAAGTTKVRELNLLPPPPSWYAVSNDNKVNLKKIPQCWGMQSMVNQTAAIKEYDTLNYSIKREYMRNVLAMMEKQYLLHRLLI